MKKKILLVLFCSLVVASLWLVGAGQVQASSTAQAEKVALGKYLASVTGCVGCHTPLQTQFQDVTNMAINDRVTLSLSARDALDQTKLLAGGQVFNLGPAGVLLTPNLTPDAETGIGKWTDLEVKDAIRTGQSKISNRTQHGIMPYSRYNNMADSDLDAIVAYLRTVPSVKNSVPANTVKLEAKPLPVKTGLVSPAPSDTAARGKYLMTSMLSCTGCHTPTDKTTGKPIAEKTQAGGQPFEGQWGIVYSANITPHETGLGSWTDADIRRVLSSGVRKDGRRLVLMIWQDVANMTDDDAKAAVHFLRKEVPPVENIAPLAALKPEYVKFVELPALQEAAAPNYALLGGVAAVVVLVVGGGLAAFILSRRQSK